MSLGVALHVEQWHRAVDGAEQIGIAREHVADEKSVVAAAFAREPLWLRDAARDQVLGHNGKIVMLAARDCRSGLYDSVICPC
jgi:hypothetical protein